MITLITLLKRRPTDTLEEFADWYSDHARFAADIPHLQRYVVSIAEEDGQVWDAVSQLTFASREDMQAALDSDIGSQSRADTREHVAAREVLVVSQSEVQLPGQ